MIWPMLGGHVYPPCYWLAFPPWHVRLNSCYTMCEETGNIYHLIFTECLCVATFSRSSGSVSFLWFASSVISLATCVITLDRALSLPRSVLSKNSSQWLSRIALYEGSTQREYVMVMSRRQVTINKVKMNKVRIPTGRTFTHGSYWNLATTESKSCYSARSTALSIICSGHVTNNLRNSRIHPVDSNNNIQSNRRKASDLNQASAYRKPPWRILCVVLSGQIQ